MKSVRNPFASAAPELTPVKRAERSSQRRLTDAERHAIVAMWSKDGSITRVANHFNVHRNTVSDLVKQVRSVQNSGSPSDWRKKLTDELPNQSVAAIERSIQDTEDVHKAASTAIAHLKGIGALQGDSGATVNVFVGSIANMPADLAGEYFEVEATRVPEEDRDT